MSATQLSAAEVSAAWPVAARKRVSTVARSSRGFATTYGAASGRMAHAWADKRQGFIARHMAQVRDADEGLWTKKGEPTRRHLALMMWAYTPNPQRTRRWLRTLRGAS